VKRWPVRVAVAVFWLCMTAWLVRYEAFPEYFSHTFGGYSDLIARDVLVADTWMRVMFGGEAVGYSHTNLEINEVDPREYYLLNNSVHVNVDLFGEKRAVDAETTASLDVLNRLHAFSVTLSMHGYHAMVNGKRTSGELFNVDIRTGTDRERVQVTIPDDVVVYSPMTMMGMRRMRPGQEVTVSVLDPLTMGKARVVLRALRTEKLEIGGAQYDATVLRGEYHGLELLTWLGKDGAILRQESPLGWAMERCTHEEALEAAEGAVDAAAILQALAGQVPDGAGK